MKMAHTTTCAPQASSIEDEAASPDPIPRAPSFHLSHSCREAAAVSHAATLADTASAASNKVNGHPEQTILQSGTFATSKNQETRSWHCVNSDQQHYAILPNNPSIKEIGTAGTREGIPSLASTSKSCTLLMQIGAPSPIGGTSKKVGKPTREVDVSRKSRCCVFLLKPC